MKKLFWIIYWICFGLLILTLIYYAIKGVQITKQIKELEYPTIDSYSIPLEDVVKDTTFVKWIENEYFFYPKHYRQITYTEF